MVPIFESLQATGDAANAHPGKPRKYAGFAERPGTLKNTGVNTQEALHSFASTHPPAPPHLTKNGDTRTS